NDVSSDAHNSFILMSSAPGSDVAYTRIKLIGATSFNSGTSGYSTFNDSANRPSSGTTILRYTPAGTTSVLSAAWSASNIDVDVRRWGVFINWRNNHASTAFKVRARLSGDSDWNYTPYLHIPGGVSDPAFAYMGVATLNGPIDEVRLEITASAA